MKTNYLIKIFTGIFITGLTHVAFVARCQDTSLSILPMFNRYHENTIKEKLYVHTDKSFYIAGEIAWFKLYVVEASGHKPLGLSEVAYVELLDGANAHLLQAKIPLSKAEGAGSFFLPSGLNSGNYKLRAYTNWMKNFGPEYFFEKNITVINVQNSKRTTSNKTENKFDIQFFPEGGNLVNSISSNIAFKATDQYGRGIVFNGNLIDNTDTLLSFAPQHSGMGTFTLTPLPGHSYKAVIKTETGETIIKNLPEVYKSGYVMTLTEFDDKIKVTVQAGALDPKEIYLLAHTREVVKLSESSDFKNGQAVFLFNKSILGDGISQITIFNDQKQPVCERLYFKKPSQRLEIGLHTDQQTYSKRGKVTISIQPGNTGLKNDSVSLSMTVFRLPPFQLQEGPRIDSYLLLTSDLKGLIEDADYYFSRDDPGTNKALDNLMLTNGWRRFKWETVLKATRPTYEYAPEYNGVMMSGNVINTKTGSIAAGVETSISVPAFMRGFNTATSDTVGHVRYELKKFYGSSQVIFQGNNAKDSGYRIDITDPYSNLFSGNPLPSFSLNPVYEDFLHEQSISMQVQNIYSAKNLRHFDTAAIDTSSFYVHPDQTYLLDNYTRFTTMEEVLREYVTMVNVRKREGKFHLSLYDFAFRDMFKNDPLVLLDGVPVFDINELMKLDPLKLLKLEVVNRRYFLGNSTFEGVLSWTSYKQDMAGYNIGPHATIIDYEGLQPEREFYTPAYESEDRLLSHMPDYRNVLLWSPHLKIGAGSSKDIPFFTSDVAGKYLIQVQGISSSGLPGIATAIFTVGADIRK